MGGNREARGQRIVLKPNHRSRTKGYIAGAQAARHPPCDVSKVVGT